jgi:putative Holliday junction resolvase
MRILGVDLGTKRIGLAISDETEVLASAFSTYQRQSQDQDFQYFRELVESEAIAKIVLGLPQNMDGSLGPKAQESIEFKDALSQWLDIPIDLFDERLTTQEAERVLVQGDVSRKKRKGLRDQLAAVLILQGYLDQKRSMLDS